MWTNKRNFNILWGFWIAEKELAQKKLNVKDIIMKYYEVWVEEFFLWYNPPYWHEQYSFAVSPNGRFGENEQISSFETLKQAVEIIHSLPRRDGDFCKVLLTMNGWQYSDLAFPLMKRMLDEANSLNIDWLIIWNFEWMQYLAEVWYKWRISISTILNAYSAEAVEFWLDFWKKNNLNIYRIVLPREVTLKEMQNIITQFPDVHFEVFGQGDYCRYANGNCFAEHKYFSRDLCTFVLKNGMEAKKKIRYDFKHLITNPNISENKKQFLMNPKLEAQDYENYEYDERNEHIFVGNALLETEHNLIPFLLDKQKECYGVEDYLPILQLIDKEITNNKLKYVYDPLLNDTHPFNKTVQSFLKAFQEITDEAESWYYDTNVIPLNTNKYKLINVVSSKVKALVKIMEEGKKYFLEEVKKKWVFWLETYYKFMLYNRTSAPFFAYFNQFPNIDVVKIPLRWRNPSIFKLWIDLIDDCIINPEKYLNDFACITWKYFHYKPLSSPELVKSISWELKK